MAAHKSSICRTKKSERLSARLTVKKYVPPAASARRSHVFILVKCWADKGWLYLAGHKDLFSGDLVGYAMSERMTRNLVSQSLFRGVAAKRPPRGLIHHSDRGSQYCAHEYRKLLDQFGMVPSMSRRGNCYDNALWKVGDCSKMNWYITGASKSAPRPFRPSPNTSKYFTGGSANRHV
jgi:transposase InsO family protein